ncbi:MAG: hypothetical protein ABII00_14975, partial [Elusimicrobiota bacterium]
MRVIKGTIVGWAASLFLGASLCAQITQHVIPAGGRAPASPFDVLTVGEPAVHGAVGGFRGFGFVHTVPWDFLSPRTTLAIGTPQATGPGGAPAGALFLSGQTLLNLTSMDDASQLDDALGSGVAFQELWVDGQLRFHFDNAAPGVGQAFSSSFTLTDADGLHTLEYFS